VVCGPLLVRKAVRQVRGERGLQRVQRVQREWGVGFEWELGRVVQEIRRDAGRFLVIFFVERRFVRC